MQFDDKQINKIGPAIANAALNAPRNKGLDCVGGGYDDASGEIHGSVRNGWMPFTTRSGKRVDT